MRRSDGVTIYLLGGLGNQLFQYALGRALQHFGMHVTFSARAFPGRAGRRVELPSGLLAGFGVSGAEDHRARARRRSAPPLGVLPLLMTSSTIPVVARSALGNAARRLLNIHIESDLDFDGTVLHLQDGSAALGFWQSPAYFDHVAAELRGSITSLLPAWDAITGVDSSVSIHVRRGDYTRGMSSLVTAALPDRYYSEAVAAIRERVPDPTFVRFSDEGSEGVDRYGLGTVIDGESGQPTDAWSVLGRMASCQHHIIANSTLSWWAAWLRSGPSSPSHVVAPQQWFRTRRIRPEYRFPASWRLV